MNGLALQVYPNPASADATLEFTTSRPYEAVSIRALDVAGRLVWKGYEGSLGMGAQRFDLPTAVWSAGTYLIQVEAEGRRITEQLMVR
jgi:hypothetical protein